MLSFHQQCWYELLSPGRAYHAVCRTEWSCGLEEPRLCHHPAPRALCDLDWPSMCQVGFGAIWLKHGHSVFPKKWSVVSGGLSGKKWGNISMWGFLLVHNWIPLRSEKVYLDDFDRCARLIQLNKALSVFIPSSTCSLNSSKLLLFIWISKDYSPVKSLSYMTMEFSNWSLYVSTEVMFPERWRIPESPVSSCALMQSCGELSRLTTVTTAIK